MPQMQELYIIKTESKKVLSLASISTAICVACVAIPIFVIRPFRPQGPRELEIALAVRHAAPWLAGTCVVILLVLLFQTWKTMRLGSRIAMIGLLLVATVCAAFTHINIFEKMFHPYGSPSFGSPANAAVDPDDKVLAVTLGQDARAYPIRTMGYHHIVNDTVNGVPIAVTYCTLCHTGLVWNRMLDGRLLHFRLAGINNGNALLRDEETNSIWQQSTGEAIYGPLKGKQLQLVRSNELSFGLWKQEQPHGQVLQPNALYASEYDPKDWEKHVEKTRTVVDTSKSGIGPHQLMLGITTAGESKAYPVQAILETKLIQDHVGKVPILLLVGPDGTSIRTFDTRVEGGDKNLTFATGLHDGTMTDAETGSTWSFQGCAVEGNLSGRCLKEIDAHKDYWFDWMNHHPDSTVFKS
jgi:Protein of unknown function (DUF3179)